MQHSYRSLSKHEASAINMTHDSGVDLGELQLSSIAERLAVRGRASLLVYLDALVRHTHHRSHHWD